MPTHNWHRWRAAFLLGLPMVALGALVGRLVHINTTLSPELRAIADKQQHGSSVIPARRGNILDRKGRVMAATRFMPDVFIDPARADDLEALAQKLGARLNLPPEAIIAKVERRPASRYVVVAQRVDKVTADAVRELHSAAVGITERSVRTYPLGTSAAHVLGFAGRDGHGLEGVELRFNEHLAGSDGKLPSIRDARRRALFRTESSYQPPRDGGDVMLTIDAEIQRITETALRKAVAKFEADDGLAIVMAPRTGEILAMACTPDFDPAAPSAVKADVRRNRALTDPTEPGSTFKPFIASGALAGGFVNRREKIDCHMGQHRFGSRLVTDTHRCGMENLTGIITHSSNIGMATIGLRMGDAALHRTICGFGFGERTGIDLPGESSGVVYDVHRWSSYSAASMSFGYEVCVTPLQLLTALSALINDGTLLTPRIVLELTGPHGEVVKSFREPKIVRRVVSSDIARYMVGEALVSVVENGSTKRVLKGPYRVLGKTGTTKLVFRNRGAKGRRRGRYEPGAYLSTFMAAAPVADPQVAIVVMVRRPNARIGFYGSKVAAPAAGEILHATLAYLEVPPDQADGEPAVVLGGP